MVFRDLFERGSSRDNVLPFWLLYLIEVATSNILRSIIHRATEWGLWQTFVDQILRIICKL